MLSVRALVSLLSLASALSLDHSENANRQLEKRLSPGQLDCPEPGGLHIIACSGHGGTPHQYGLLESLVTNITTAIPGSNNYSIPYPKMSEDKPAAIAAGVILLRDNVEEYIEACPDTAIVLMGYSQGAIVNMNTICGRSKDGAPFQPGLKRKYRSNVIAYIGYGDETRVPYQTYNRGTCKRGRGEVPRANPGGCTPWEDRMESYCDRKDPRCCVPYGNVTSAHFVYPNKYNAIATSWVMDQFDAWTASRT